MDFNFAQSAPKPDSLSDCHAVIEGLWGYNQGHILTIRELVAQQRRDSTNSSSSPSNDNEATRKKRREQQENRIKSGLNQGAQPGHIGKGRKLIPTAEVDTVISCYAPSQCHCGETLSVGIITQRKQVFNIDRGQLEVIEYQVHLSVCSGCKHKHRGQLPDDAPAGILSANSIAVTTSLTGTYQLSKAKAAALLYDIFALKISVGTVSNAEHIMANALKAPHAAIHTAVLASAYSHEDETGWYTQHKRSWLWLTTTREASYFLITPNRNQASAKALVGEEIKSLHIVDRYNAYSFIPDKFKQYCWSHLKRDIADITGSDNPVEAAIGNDLETIRREIFACYPLFKATPAATMPKFIILDRIKAFHRTLRRGKTLEEKCKAQAFCKNLLKHFTCLWQFLRYDDVDPTNNHAEREIRKGVTWRKKSNGTQSRRGDRYVERILSVSNTCRLQGRNAISVLAQAVRALWGHAEYPSVV